MTDILSSAMTQQTKHMLHVQGYKYDSVKAYDDELDSSKLNKSLLSVWLQT